APPSSARRIRAPAQMSVDNSTRASPPDVGAGRQPWINASLVTLPVNRPRTAEGLSRSMTRTRAQARPAARWMGLMGAALVSAPTLAAAQPQDLFYERTAIMAADDRCNLFTPEVSAALAASAAQARGAALRAGANARDLTAAERDARARVA